MAQAQERHALIPLWLLNPKVWAAAIVAVLIGLLGLQSARLAHAKSDLSRERAVAVRWKAVAASSELNRAHEYTDARNAVSDAENACQARIAFAMKSATKIRTIVEKPREVPIDSITHCPGRGAVPNGELRDLFAPGS